MLHSIKKRLYFVVAAYFTFWAKIVLRRWQPRIIVVTGSSGKTTLLHLIEAQLGTRASYSHHANSAFGISFQLLGLEPNVLSISKWPLYVLVAPFRIWRRIPNTKLYVVEADCDRPREGKFSANFLRPEVTLWVSVHRTHSMNFDSLVSNGKFATHEGAIANEFGGFVAATTKLVAVNSDQDELVEQLARAAQGVQTERVSTKAITSYIVQPDSTVFSFGQKKITLPGLHPREVGIALQLVDTLLRYLDLPPDSTYKQLTLPPGRSTIFKGKKGTTLIDSTYNTGLGATVALLGLFQAYPATHKWLVIGDILEQGSLEQEEHKKLVVEIANAKPEHVILLGKRTKAHTYSLLQKELPSSVVVSFLTAGEVLKYLQQQIRGGEAIMFKGAQGLEGVVEQLLASPSDAQQLVRRETSWVKRRQAWGLPK